MLSFLTPPSSTPPQKKSEKGSIQITEYCHNAYCCTHLSTTHPMHSHLYSPSNQHLSTHRSLTFRHSLPYRMAPNSIQSLIPIPPICNPNIPPSASTPCHALEIQNARPPSIPKLLTTFNTTQPFRFKSALS
jgi:hypothetical protein